jgi:hypothetical protein
MFFDLGIFLNLVRVLLTSTRGTKWVQWPTLLYLVILAYFFKTFWESFILIFKLHINDPWPHQKGFLSLKIPLRKRDNLNSLIFQQLYHELNFILGTALQDERRHHTVPVDVIGLDVVRGNDLRQILRKVKLVIDNAVEVSRACALLTEGREFTSLLGRACKHEAGRLVAWTVLVADHAYVPLNPKKVFFRRL